MKRFFPFLFIIVAVFAVQGQNASSNCPTISVMGPAAMTSLGQPMAFTASVKGSQAIGMPEYQWTVSAGLISSGQGTSSINVNTTGLPNNSNVTAIVKIKGLPIGCNDVDSDTGSISGPVCNLPLDHYGRVSWNEERARLDNMQINLANNPDSRLYIFLRITADESFDDAKKHSKKVINHFKWRNKAFDAGLVTFVIYVSDEHSVISSIVPKGVEGPKYCESGCIEISGSSLLKN